MWFDEFTLEWYKKVVRQWRVFSAVILASLFLLSCQKTVKQPVSTPPVDSRQTQPNASSPRKQGASPQAGAPTTSAALPVGQPGAAAAQPAPQPAAAAAAPSDKDQKPGQIRSMANAASLMALGHTARLLPEDFKIGPLGDNRGAQHEENGAIAAAEAFLKSIVAGSVDMHLLTPDSQDAVADALSYGLKQGYKPNAYRLGAPKSQENGQITATVRLFSAAGTSEGEIYLSRAGTEWLVADLQLNLAQLSVKREPVAEKFFPSSYRWLLEGN